MKVTTTFHLAPIAPRPTLRPQVDINVHWSVPSDYWEEYGLPCLVSDGWIEGCDIPMSDYGDELDVGIDFTCPTAEDMIAEICGSFKEMAENERFYRDNIDEDQENEQEVLDQIFYQYDYNLPISILNVIYGKHPSEMEISELFELSRAENWGVMENMSIAAVEE